MDMHLMGSKIWSYLRRLWAGVPHDAAADRQFERRVGIMSAVNEHTKGQCSQPLGRPYS